MKRFLAVFVLTFILSQLHAQLQAIKREWTPGFNVGVGYGLDYGGLGGRLSILPLERLQVFGALGYFMEGVCFNAGANTRVLTKTRFTPYLGGMYGNNAYIISKDRQLSTVPNKNSRPETHYYRYYGVSLNAGLECWITSRTFINFELILPVPGKSYKEDIKSLINKFGTSAIEETGKIGISAGIHFRIFQN